jgi:extracellular factor (EF) 3-hydroxypalmitic acid methyl ester biosynthesis protein
MRQGNEASSEAPSSQSSPKTERLRTRRIRVEDLRLGTVIARTELGSGPVEAQVEDLSQHGVALVIEASRLGGALVLAGDRLPTLVLESGGTTLYEGSGVVRRATERGTEVVLGVELASTGVNLAEVYRHGTRRGFAERMRAAEGTLRAEQVSAEFKAYVADFAGYLAAMRDFFTAEEKALEAEDRMTREDAVQQYLAEAARPFVQRLNAYAAEHARLVGDLTEDLHAICRAYARTHILPLFLEAPFTRRAYQKPLGYAGDYEMMNMLYRDHAEGDTLFAKVLNIYATQEGAAQANINRINYLCTEIRAVVQNHGSADRVRMASIGCGPTREIRKLLEENGALGPRLDVALIDQEERSIAFCERTLGPLGVRTGARINFIRESVRRLLTTRALSETLGERELIYSAGLFDYLSQAAFARLLSTLYEALVPGGVLLIGNVATHNPSRWMMEYYLDWFLIHRSAEELLALAGSLSPTPASVEVKSEPSGINLFLRITR